MKRGLKSILCTPRGLNVIHTARPSERTQALPRNKYKNANKKKKPGTKTELEASEKKGKEKKKLTLLHTATWKCSKQISLDLWQLRKTMEGTKGAREDALELQQKQQTQDIQAGCPPIPASLLIWFV